MYDAVETKTRSRGPLPMPRQTPNFRRQYDEDATLLLVGILAAGKKTLGIIASVALRRRFIDFEAFFRQETSASPQDFIARHGLTHYRELELKLSQDLLTKHDKGCVIVGLGGSASRELQVLLVEFGQRHPVIYVRRDEEDLRHFMSTSPEKFDRLFKAGNSFFESCSNFDFFNHTQGQQSEQAQTQPPLPTYLKLKQTERVFKKFLRRILGKCVVELLPRSVPSTSHTYALQVPLRWLDQANWDLEFLEVGADAVTLVIDSDEDDLQRLRDRLVRHMATLRTCCRVPLIIDIANLMEARQEEYDMVLETIVRLMPDVVICSMHLDRSLMSKLTYSKGAMKIIVAVHESSPVGSSDRKVAVKALAEKFQGSKFDALRITGESTSVHDYFDCLSYSRNIEQMLKVPVIAYNLGPMGRPSICFNGTLSPVALRGTSGVKVHEAQNALAASFIIPKRQFTIFGQGVKHSLSPAMHNTGYSASGLPYHFDALLGSDISDVLPLLENEVQGGMIISTRFKSDIIPYVDEVSSDATDINAVNTIVFEEGIGTHGDRKILRRGYNTDHIGIRDSIYGHLSPANAVRDGSSALIIGAGGMARAAVFACYELGVRRICVYNRTYENAQKLVDYFHQWAESKPVSNFQLNALDSSDQWPENTRLPTIVVACIPPYKTEGGKDLPVAMQIPERWLESRTGGVYVEVAYGPLQTPLMKQMLTRTTRGWVVVDGLKVFYQQGTAQYELLTKRPAPVHAMRRTVEEQSVKYGYAHQ